MNAGRRPTSVGRRCLAYRLWLLANDQLRIFIRAKTLELRLAQQVVLGPLGVCDLGHQLRFAPVYVLAAQDFSLREGRPIDAEFVELRPQLAQHLVVEPRADLSGEDEVLLVVTVIADKDRSQSDARLPRIGKTANHEFLPSRAFDFQPRAAAVIDVRAVEAFGDDAFAVADAGLVEHGDAFAACGVGPEDWLAPRLDR